MTQPLMAAAPDGGHGCQLDNDIDNATAGEVMHTFHPAVVAANLDLLHGPLEGSCNIWHVQGGRHG
jgi:hypothetical protein